MVYIPGWLRGHEAVFQEVLDTTRWKAQQRMMYERMVEVPRWVAMLPEDGPGHPILWEAADRLSAEYGWDLRSLGAALYRNGRDSVAPHGDKLGRLARNTVVAIVSLGERRKFAMRRVRRSPGSSTGNSQPCAIDLRAGWGDLVVMGGSCQVTWLHGVPKSPSAGPRISIQFRPRVSSPLKERTAIVSGDTSDVL